MGQESEYIVSSFEGTFHARAGVRPPKTETMPDGKIRK